MNILVVTATQREADALAGLSAIAAGTRTAAGEALQRELESQKPELVLIAGICGGLDPSLRTGSVILGRAARASGEEDLFPAQAPLQQLQRRLRARHAPFVSSALVTVDAPVATKEQKTALWNEFGAGGVDMETYWLAQAATSAGVPWLAIRCVLDTAGQSLPASLRSWSGDSGEGAIARHAAARPWEWPGLLETASEWRTASRRLRRAATFAVRCLEDREIEVPLPTTTPIA